MAINLTVNKRKGLVATLLIHLILFLLMLQWIMRTDKVLAEEEGGLMVTFNTEQSGGPDETTEFAESTESPQTEDQPEPEETVTETQPQPQVTQPITETTDAEDAPTVNTQEKTEPVEKEPELDPNLKNRLSKLGSRTRNSNSNQDRRSGDGPGNEGTGSPDATNRGPGGSGIGTNPGDGWAGNFGGFNISGGKLIHADFEETGVVILDICVDKYGRITINGRAPGTSTYDAELYRIAREAANSYKFNPKSGTTTGGCGTFKVTFKKTSR